MTSHALLAIVATLAVAAGCEREMRRFEKPKVTPLAQAERQGGVQPGQPGPGIETVETSATYDERNAYEISQGKRLFRWYNCNGCHGSGGGGMGPPLMDGAWRYGHEPAQIFTTIMQGRANGMPAFRGRIPEEHAWQLVAYVRSMSGLVPNPSMPGRADTLSPGQPEVRRDRIEPAPEASSRKVLPP